MTQVEKRKVFHYKKFKRNTKNKTEIQHEQGWYDPAV